MARSLTIHEAAQTTGWSARMLRYIEQAGLVVPARSEAGYRLYGPGELQRLRTLRELLERHDVELSELGFALRLRHDANLRRSVDEWFEARARRPDDVTPDDWLRFEQDKHERLLAEINGRPHPASPSTPVSTSTPSHESVKEKA